MSRHGSNPAYGTNEWTMSGQGNLQVPVGDKFGQHERTGVVDRSSFGTRRNDEYLREQLLDELSVLRRRHDSLQMRNRSSILEAPSLTMVHGEVQQQPSSYYLSQLGPGSYFSGPSAPAVDDKVGLDQTDKDAIEALFAVDDFAQIFNAGGKVISNLPSMPVHSGNLPISHQ